MACVEAAAADKAAALAAAEVAATADKAAAKVEALHHRLSEEQRRANTAEALSAEHVASAESIRRELSVEWPRALVTVCEEVVAVPAIAERWAAQGRAAAW